MKKVNKKVRIGHSHGIHIRIAQEIVKASQQFTSEITLLKPFQPDEPINAGAILDLMTAGIGFNEEVEIICIGEDADKAIKTIEYILISNFDKNG
ncbi:MAG TPA: hypothetical protein DHW82_07380 [Spirochaetia bacterium]|nr:MAG: hypothetical protein A2Y41_12195 [Spirochaetes bacterium GWB1_36_13]HCL56814.1 hypothetical protein [Spirochaetia bacterium]